MALGTDFLLTLTGDVDMTNGGSTQVVSISQAIQKKFRLIKDEWFADLSAGVPYYEEVWVKDPEIAHLEQIFKSTALELAEVKSVISMTLDYNKTTRTLLVRFEVDTIEGVISDSVEI